MILLIDIGNSRLKWALWDGRALSPAVALPHEGAVPATLVRLPARKLSAVWVASVVGVAQEPAIEQALKARYCKPVHFARSRQSHLGLHSAYADATRLGVDRWLMMLAAWCELRAACCVVSAGTALTLDAIDADGRHQGGFIAPGLNAMLQATLGSTRFNTLPLGAAFHGGLGIDTEDCVRQGAYLAVLGVIDRGHKAAGAPPLGLICGGDAAVLLPQLGPLWQRRDDLVLRGLLALAVGASG